MAEVVVNLLRTTRAASRAALSCVRQSHANESIHIDKHRDTLEHHETMMGTSRGRLAVALDLLTDSLALVGQHGGYCRSERFPGQPRMDIASFSSSWTMPSGSCRVRWRNSAAEGHGPADSGVA